MHRHSLRNQGIGLAHGIVWFAAGFVVGAGILDGDTLVQITGALITIAGGLVSIRSNTDASIAARADSNLKAIKEEEKGS